MQLLLIHNSHAHYAQTNIIWPLIAGIIITRSPSGKWRRYQHPPRLWRKQSRQAWLFASGPGRGQPWESVTGWESLEGAGGGREPAGRGDTGGRTGAAAAFRAAAAAWSATVAMGDGEVWVGIGCWKLVLLAMITIHKLPAVLQTASDIGGYAMKAVKGCMYTYNRGRDGGDKEHLGTEHC